MVDLYAQIDIFEFGRTREENFQRGLAYVGLDEVEQTRVRKAITIFDPDDPLASKEMLEDVFRPGEKKYNSMVFCEVLVKSFGIHYQCVGDNIFYSFDVTEKMKEFAEEYFQLNKNHVGFYSAFLVSKKVEIYLN